MTTKNVAQLEIVENTDEITGCNVCGIETYVATRDNKIEQIGRKLWDVRVGKNSVWVTRYCRSCLIELRKQVDVVLKEVS